MKEIQELASEITEELKKLGFILQRYDSVTTNSVYLKLDYGLSNSIRISDHTGKQHLRYRYNVLQFCEKPSKSFARGGYPRNFYGFNDINKLLSDIVEEKKLKITKYGENAYSRFMLMEKMKNRNQKGFWSKCHEV